MITQAPELWDGGWWYVVEAIPTEDGEGIGTGVGVPHAAFYGAVAGVTYAVVRTAEDFVATDVGVDVSEVITAAQIEGSLPIPSKPFARHGGR